MKPHKKRLALLVVDEEMEQCIPAPEGCITMRDVFSNHCENESLSLRILQTNQELLDYLYQRNGYEDAKHNPLPDLIILDFYYPKTERKITLEQIKNDQRLQSIPIVILSRDEGRDEIDDYYKLHANSYIRKPQSADDLAEIVSNIRRYWFETSGLPDT